MTKIPPHVLESVYKIEDTRVWAIQDRIGIYPGDLDVPVSEIENDG